jgi:hypothetical protein
LYFCSFFFFLFFLCILSYICISLFSILLRTRQ